MPDLKIIVGIASKDKVLLSKIYIPTTKPDDWQSLLAALEKHWRKGCSARALAFSWQEAGGFHASIST
jgi:hypothetical protein